MNPAHYRCAICIFSATLVELRIPSTCPFSKDPLVRTMPPGPPEKEFGQLHSSR